MSGPRLGTAFWRLWAAFASTNLGDGLGLVAIPLMAFTLTDDARLVAFVSAARVLPFLVVALPAGVLLDRSDRRLVAIGAQLGRGAALAGLAMLITADMASIELLAVAAFTVGVSEVLTDSGLPAMVRQVVAADVLEVANSRISAAQTVTNLFVGPPLGAILFQLDHAAPFVVSVGLAVATVMALHRVPAGRRPNGGDSAAPFRQQIVVGLRYVWGHDVLRPLALAVGLFSFVGEAGNAVFVVLAKERFGLTDIGFGILLGIDGVASVIMSFFVAVIVRRTSHSTSLRVAVVTYMIAALLFGLGTVVAVAVLGAVVTGMSDPSWNVVSATIRQRLVPDEVFGRMMTAYLFVAWSFQPLGALLGGAIAERWGPQWVFLLSGIVVGSLLVLGRPLFRSIDRAMA